MQNSILFGHTARDSQGIAELSPSITDSLRLFGLDRAARALSRSMLRSRQRHTCLVAGGKYDLKCSAQKLGSHPAGVASPRRAASACRSLAAADSESEPHVPEASPGRRRRLKEPSESVRAACRARGARLGGSDARAPRPWPFKLGTAPGGCCIAQGLQCKLRRGGRTGRGVA